MSSEEVHASKSVQEEQNVKHFQCKKCKTFFTSKAQQEEHDLVVHDKEKKTNVIFVKNHLVISKVMLKLFMETMNVFNVICVKIQYLPSIIWNNKKPS